MPSPASSTATTGSWLAEWFGPPFRRLPTDVRARFEARYDAAVGNSLDGLSSRERLDRTQALSAAGFPRLDSAALVEHLRLYETALRSTNTTTCANIARSGSYAGDTTGIDPALRGLDPKAYAHWMEIEVEAIEAGAAASPAPRTVAQDDLSAISATIMRSLSPGEILTLWPGDPATLPPPDEVSCAAYRHYYAIQLALGPADLATYALYSVSAEVIPAATASQAGTLDAMSGLTVGAPYGLVELDEGFATAMVSAMRASMGPSYVGSISLREVVEKSDPVGLLVVFEIPGGLSSDPDGFSTVLVAAMGGERAKRVSVEGHDAVISTSRAGAMGAYRRGGDLVLVTAKDAKTADSVLRSVIKASE